MPRFISVKRFMDTRMKYITFFSGSHKLYNVSRRAQVRAVGSKGHSYEAVVVWKYIPPNAIFDLPVRRWVFRRMDGRSIYWQSINNSSPFYFAFCQEIENNHQIYEDSLFIFCENLFVELFSTESCPIS